MDHWLPLFFDHMDTIFDYVPKWSMTMDAQAEQARVGASGADEDFYQARRTLEDSAKSRKVKKDGGDVSLSGTIYHPLPPAKLYLNAIELGALAPEAEICLPFLPLSPPGRGRVRGLLAEVVISAIFAHCLMGMYLVSSKSILIFCFLSGPLTLTLSPEGRGDGRCWWRPIVKGRANGFRG